MRRMGFALALALLCALTACKEGFSDPTPGSTGPARPVLEFIAQNVRILPGEKNAVRISFSPKDPSARIRIERSADGGRVRACPLAGIDDAIPAGSPCLPDLPAGVRESLTTPGLSAIALVREGEPITLGIRIEYAESRSRAIGIRIPIVERPPGASVCKDNGCNPFFEVTPARGGSFKATARWSGGDARLALLEGRVLARSFTSTGIPYRTVTDKTGPSPLGLAGPMSAPSEYALALINASGGNLVDIEIETIWP